MKTIVIVGAGFGGIYAARRLLKRFPHSSGVTVTLINPSNYFLFVPMLHEVAGGGLCGHNLIEPIHAILRAKNFRFVPDVALRVELRTKRVVTQHESIRYDFLVLATGSRSNFFGVPGAAEHALTLKDLQDALEIKRQVIGTVEHALCLTRREVTVALIGAGATGIELACELAEFTAQVAERIAHPEVRTRIVLLHRGGSVLPQFPKFETYVERALRRQGIELLLRAEVARVGQRKIVLNDGTRIAADVIIWTAGVQPNPVVTQPNAADGRGFFAVNEFLQLPLYPEVFAAGDCASFTPAGSDRPMPMLAQIASEEGKHIAKNIARSLLNRPLRPFRYRIQGILLSLGRKKGIGVVKGIPVRGFLAWWLMRTIYLFKIIGTANKLRTAYDWTLNLFMKRDTCQR